MSADLVTTGKQTGTLADRILAQHLQLTASKVVLGFDAFVDVITRPIAEGSAGQICRYFETMEEFGRYIVDRSGMNGSVELAEQSIKLGGNTPNLAHALGRLGARIHCLAPFGQPEINAVFHPLLQYGELFSTGEPGISYALEFANSKLFLALNRAVNQLGWPQIIEALPLERLRDLTESARMICFLNWSEVPGSTSIIRELTANILMDLPGTRPLLIDLSDCTRRSTEDLNEILDLIAHLPPSVQPVLSMNQNEANRVCRALSISKEIPEKESGRLLLDALNLHWVVFHNRLRSVLVSRKGFASYETRMTCEPQLLTGAGDNFNAGLCAGMIMELDPVDCLQLAGLTSGYYVEHANSASMSELVEYIKDMEAAQ